MASGPDSGLSLEVLSLCKTQGAPDPRQGSQGFVSPELLGSQDKPSDQK